MAEQKIRVRIVGDDARTALIMLSGYRLEPGIAARSVALHEIIDNYKGPRVQLDFNKEGELIAIEVLA